MTDEQFKAWAKTFLERTDWRGAAVDALEMLEKERAMSAKLASSLQLVLGTTLVMSDKHDWTTCGEFSCKNAREALAEYRDTSK